MYLTASNLAFHLMARGIITARSVVGGDFTLVEIGRRNRNFKVYRKTAPGLFVKQIKTSEAQAVLTLQREAMLYRRVKENPALKPLAPLMPELVDYDPTRYALVVSLLDNSESVSDLMRRTATIPEALASAGGRALATCHAQLPAALADEQLRPLLPAQMPWVLSLETMGYQVLENFGGIGPQLAAAIKQYPALQPGLSALRLSYKYDSLVHGDPKWDNFVITPREGGGGAGEDFDLKIVDWELVDVGDAAWDLGMLFKDFLVTWLLAVPDPATGAPLMPGTRPPDEILKDVQQAARAFWGAYAATRGLAGDAARQLLYRSVQHTAARLIVAVLEYFQMVPQLTYHAYAMVQMSAQTIQNPEATATTLLGS
jgi:aminoglycoside phosphotransferase (APT) family kinase protein